MRFLFFLLLLIVNGLLMGQQLPQYTQYLNNFSVINSSNILNEENQINLGARSQMLGFGLEPNTTYCIGQFTIPPKKINHYNPSIRISKEIPKDTSKYNRFKQGVGGGIILDSYGAMKIFSMQSFYAIGYQLINDWRLNFAIKGAFSNVSIDKDRVSVLNINNPHDEYAGGDLLFDALQAESATNNSVQGGLSATLKSKELLLGASIENITSISITETTSAFQYSFLPQISILASYNYQLEGYGNLKTGILLKKMNTRPALIEGSVIAFSERGYYFGINYRHRSSVGAIVGFHLSNTFKLGYSMDVLTTKLNNFSYGGHEITLGYVFN